MSWQGRDDISVVCYLFWIWGKEVQNGCQKCDRRC